MENNYTKYLPTWQIWQQSYTALSKCQLLLWTLSEHCLRKCENGKILLNITVITFHKGGKLYKKFTIRND